MTSTPPGSGVRVRREPPRFRAMTAAAVEHLSPRLVRIMFTGPELVGLTVPEPAASVRVLFPVPGADDVVLPTWNGNEFLEPDGARPPIRTLTPLFADGDAGELDVAIVLHGA